MWCHCQIYGEILFFPFAEALRWVAPSLPEHAIFYDLVRTIEHCQGTSSRG